MGVYYYIINEKKKVAFYIGKHEPMASPEDIFEPMEQIMENEQLFFDIDDFKEQEIRNGIRMKDIATVHYVFSIVERLGQIYSFRHLLALLLMYLWPEDWEIKNEYEFEPTRRWRVIE